MKGEYLIAEIKNSLKKIEKHNRTALILGVSMAVLAIVGLIIYIVLRAKDKDAYSVYGDFDDYDDFDEFDYADYDDEDEDYDDSYHTLNYEE